MINPSGSVNTRTIVSAQYQHYAGKDIATTIVLRITEETILHDTRAETINIEKVGTGTNFQRAHKIRQLVQAPHQGEVCQSMKCLLCKLCGDLVPLGTHTKWCTCGNVVGHYRANGQDVEIDVTKGDWATLRIVGIDNSLLRNEVLPPYHAKPDTDGRTLFHQWGSAIIAIPPWIPNDVYKLDPSRFPEIKFWTEENKL